MKLIKILIPILAVFISFLNVTAQDFKYKKKSNKYVFKSENGKWDEGLAFDKVEYLGSKGWYVNSDELWGVVNKKGEFSLPLKFQKIDFFSDTSNLVKLNGVWGEYKDDIFTPAVGEIIFKKPDEKAYLSKCEDANNEKCFLDEINLNIRYPKEAVIRNIQGTMIAELIIDEKGKVESCSIIRKIGGGCDEEFMRVIETHLNQWEPAKNEGKPVKSLFYIPIKMKLY